MAQLERIANWCKPCIEGDYIVFRHAYKWGGKWYDIRVLQEEEGRVVTPTELWIKGRLQVVQDVALKKIIPKLSDPTTQVVSYGTGTQGQTCYVDKEQAPEPVFEGMKEIDTALKGEFGGASLNRKNLSIPLKRYHRAPAPLQAPQEAPAPAEVPASPAAGRAQLIETIDRETIDSRFDPNVSYRQFEKSPKDQLYTPIYNAYLKLVDNPRCADEDAVRMREWLEAVHASATKYYEGLYSSKSSNNKLEAAEALINFILVDTSGLKLINYLSSL